MKPEEGVEFLHHVAEVESTNRVTGLEDLRFRYGDQWLNYMISARSVVGQERPMLTINEVDAYCRHVENQQKQQRPRIKVHAVDDIADPKIAKVCSGLFRHIEANSNADNAYDKAFSHALTMGWGYFRMQMDFIYGSMDQDIFISPVENPFTVYFDTNSSLPDGSDAEKCLITDLVDKKAFEKEYPGAATQGFTETSGSGDSQPDWVTEEEIRIAEYFYTEKQKQRLVKLSNGQTLWADQFKPEQLTASGLQVVGDRETYRKTVKWCKQTTFEILEEKVIPGRWIPVIPVYGSSYIVDGKRVRFGLVRFGKDPARMNNYWQTAVTEYLALMAKAKWLMAEGQDEGFENEWAQANNSTKPILHHKQTDSAGKEAPPPQRIQPEPAPAGMIQAAMMASQNLQRVMGEYDPGITQSKMHKSDKTINAETQQSDQSNFHYYDNLCWSIQHAGRIGLGWFPVTYDTQRVMRIIGEDGRPDLVTINEKQQQQTPEGQAVQKVLNDLTVGTYDVVMDTGPGYNSKRQEAVAVFTQMLDTPLGEKIAQVADDIVVRQLDVPGSDVIADRLAAANPLSKIDEKSDIPPQAQMQIATLQKQLEEAQKLLQQAAQEIKFKQSIEQMRQDGETKRALMKETSDAHEREITQAQKQHDTETYAISAQNVAEINGLVKLLTSKTEHGHRLREMLLEFEHATSLQDKQLAAKSAETETVQ